jgi:hypothetical protein
LFDQQEQDLHGDSLQPQSTASAAQLIGAPVQFQTVSESHHVRWHFATN